MICHACRVCLCNFDDCGINLCPTLIWQGATLPFASCLWTLHVIAYTQHTHCRDTDNFTRWIFSYFARAPTPHACPKQPTLSCMHSLLSPSLRICPPTPPLPHIPHPPSLLPSIPPLLTHPTQSLKQENNANYNAIDYIGGRVRVRMPYYGYLMVQQAMDGGADIVSKAVTGECKAWVLRGQKNGDLRVLVVNKVNHKVTNSYVSGCGFGYVVCSASCACVLYEQYCCYAYMCNTVGTSKASSPNPNTPNLTHPIPTPPNPSNPNTCNYVTTTTTIVTHLHPDPVLPQNAFKR